MNTSPFSLDFATLVAQEHFARVEKGASELQGYFGVSAE